MNMQELIMTIIKRAAVFMILAQAVIHFRPNPSYEKYFRFLAGIMTAVILALPMLEWLKSGIGGQYQAALAAYTERLEEAAAQGNEEENTPVQTYLFTMEEEIKSKLNNSLSDTEYCVESVKLKGVLENGSVVQEGESRLFVILRPKNTGISTITVDKIEVMGKSDGEEEERRRERAFGSRIAAFLGMEEDGVEVKIVE